jgi:hypothetical protein
MHRFFGFLALTAVGLGLFVLLAGPDTEPSGAGAQALQGAPVAYSGWAVGLIMGLILAWLAGLDWTNLPVRTALWLKLQRRRLGWAVFGGLFAAILLLF